MKDLVNAIRESLGESMDIRDWPDAGVVNILPRGRDLAPEDVEAVRVILAEKGYVEIKSWVALEGASWLSSGIESVSFKVRKAAS